MAKIKQRYTLVFISVHDKHNSEMNKQKIAMTEPVLTGSKQELQDRIVLAAGLH